MTCMQLEGIEIKNDDIFQLRSRERDDMHAMKYAVEKFSKLYDVTIPRTG